MEEKQEKRTLSTYLEPELADKVEEEARRLKISTSAVIRWALMDRYKDE